MQPPKRLNIGAGRDYMEGWINADISEEVGADIVCQLGQRLPFKDNEFSEVKAYNVLCQIQMTNDFIYAMNELHRVTNGYIYVRVPNAADICAFQDPMDSRRFTTESFTYMEHNHKRYIQYGKHYGFLPFKVDLLENKQQMIFRLQPVK
jgi:predicted SAM-dependent methyltransferase